MLERFPRLRARLHRCAGLPSVGEQQMLAPGLIAKPRLLLLDEPSLIPSVSRRRSSTISSTHSTASGAKR
jgi:ABC-type branched-subunit amino acid transport system ATPase component